MNEEDQIPSSFVPDSFVPDHVDEHPQSGLSIATHSFLEKHPTARQILQRLMSGVSDEDKQRPGYTPLSGQDTMEIPGIKAAGNKIENKLTATGSYPLGFAGGIIGHLADVFSTGFDPRTAGIKTPSAVGNLMKGIEADKASIAASEVVKPRLASEIVNPQTAKSGLDPSKLVFGEKEVTAPTSAGKPQFQDKKFRVKGGDNIVRLDRFFKGIEPEHLAAQMSDELEHAYIKKPIAIENYQQRYDWEDMNENEAALELLDELESKTPKLNLVKELKKEIYSSPDIYKQPLRVTIDRNAEDPNIGIGGHPDSPAMNPLQIKNKYFPNKIEALSDAQPPNKPPNMPPGNVPPSEPPEPPPNNKISTQEQSKTRQAYEAARSLMAVDLPFTTSAAFRQASPFVGTKKWFQAWEKSAKSYGSKEFYDGLMQNIVERPNFKSGLADELGLKMTDVSNLSRREESIRSSLAEKIPLYGAHVRASNRAYTSFLNYIRAETFDDLVTAGKLAGKDPEKDLVFGRQITDFINDATGRGSLKFKLGTKEINIEHSAKLLSDTLFSPRLIASRINMLNPSTYIMTDPMIRKQYMYGMLRSIGSWWGIASLAELAGVGEVVKDANSADFGKIRIGDTRIDPGAGFQQYLVLGHRMLPESLGGGGIQSSVADKFTPYGEGYKPTTRWDSALDFATNKLHPIPRFVVDLLRAQPKRPFNVFDRTAQMAFPIIAGDISQLVKQDPGLWPLILGGSLAGTSGMGVQTYSRGTQEPTFIPNDYDFSIGAK